MVICGDFSVLQADMYITIRTEEKGSEIPPRNAMTNICTIHPICKENLSRYGEIYAAAFSGEPWNDPWNVEDATIHVRELLESRQAYGLECVIDGQVAGFILGTSMLFHYGRTFEINDLAVAPEHQNVLKTLRHRELWPYI